MTPDDLAALLKWSYARDDGGGWLPAAAADLRIAERNLRGMLGGRVAIPDMVRAFVVETVALRLELRGWWPRVPELLALPLSPETWRAIRLARVDTAAKLPVDHERPVLP